MNIILKEELESLKETINVVNSKKDLLKIVSETELLSSFSIFVKTAKLQDSKQLLLTVIQDKLQIFQVQAELAQVKSKSKTTSKKQRTVTEKENSSLFSVFDLLFNKSKYLINEDYLESENVKAIYEQDKTKNFKADLYRRLKRYNTLSEKNNKTDKEENELETLKTYLSDVFDCDEESQLETVLSKLDSDSIKEAAELLAYYRKKEYNFISFDSYVKVLKVYTIALDSNNLTELEKVLEGFLEFVENQETLQNQEESEENTGKNGKKP